MPEPTLTSIFGNGASQTATNLIISKADLPGLTATANNTAESLVVGLILKFQSGLTKLGFDSDTTQSIYLSRGYASFVYRGTNNDEYRVDQVICNFAKLDAGAAIDPDDY